MCKCGVSLVQRNYSLVPTRSLSLSKGEFVEQSLYQLILGQGVANGHAISGGGVLFLFVFIFLFFFSYYYASICLFVSGISFFSSHYAYICLFFRPFLYFFFPLRFCLFIFFSDLLFYHFFSYYYTSRCLFILSVNYYYTIGKLSNLFYLKYLLKNTNGFRLSLITHKANKQRIHHISYKNCSRVFSPLGHVPKE